MNTKDKIIQSFKSLLEDNKRNINMIVKVAERAKLTNEQFYIEWEDFLNKISNKDHNK